MVYPASLEEPLVGGNNRDHSRWWSPVSCILVANAALAAVVTGLVFFGPFNAVAGVSKPADVAATSLTSLNASASGCSKTWCEDRGLAEDACSCGVCGSYGACSWSCDVSRSTKERPLHACKSDVWRFWGPVSVTLAALGVVLVVVIAGIMKCKRNAEKRLAERRRKALEKKPTTLRESSAHVRDVQQKTERKSLAGHASRGIKKAGEREAETVPLSAAEELAAFQKQLAALQASASAEKSEASAVTAALAEAERRHKAELEAVRAEVEALQQATCEESSPVGASGRTEWYTMDDLEVPETADPGLAASSGALLVMTSIGPAVLRTRRARSLSPHRRRPHASPQAAYCECGDSGRCGKRSKREVTDSVAASSPTAARGRRAESQQAIQARSALDQAFAAFERSKQLRRGKQAVEASQVESQQAIDSRRAFEQACEAFEARRSVAALEKHREEDEAPAADSSESSSDTDSESSAQEPAKAAGSAAHEHEDEEHWVPATWTDVHPHHARQHSTFLRDANVHELDTHWVPVRFHQHRHAHRHHSAFILRHGVRKVH